jgi:hypothetical protein
MNGLNSRSDDVTSQVVAPILPRSNNQPKAKTVNRIAAIVRSVRNDSSFFDFVESSTVATTLQEAMRVLNDCHTDSHPEPVNEDCPLCYAMRLCAGELITLKSHAVDTLDQIESALWGRILERSLNPTISTQNIKPLFVLHIKLMASVNAASGFSRNLTIRADSAPATSAIKTHATVASRFAGTVSGKSGNIFAGFTIRKSQPTLHNAFDGRRNAQFACAVFIAKLYLNSGWPAF